MKCQYIHIQQTQQHYGGTIVYFMLSEFSIGVPGRLSGDAEGLVAISTVCCQCIDGLLVTQMVYWFSGRNASDVNRERARSGSSIDLRQASQSSRCNTEFLNTN
jgi:hypothetical protein